MLKIVGVNVGKDSSGSLKHPRIDHPLALIAVEFVVMFYVLAEISEIELPAWGWYIMGLIKSLGDEPYRAMNDWEEHGYGNRHWYLNSWIHFRAEKERGRAVYDVRPVMYDRAKCGKTVTLSTHVGHPSSILNTELIDR